jgi:uncharacterized membrane protein YphA (DoxX/SURF4 family)
VIAVDPVLAWIARLGLCALFGAAALHKARDLGVFTATLRDYRMLPDRLAPIAAPVVAVCELATAAALLVPALAPRAALAALGLLTTYSAAIAWNLARGRRHIDCGCLGPAHHGQPLSPWLLARNGTLALGALVALAPEAQRAASWVDALSVLGGATMLLVLWSAAHRLATAQLHPSGRPA